MMRILIATVWLLATQAPALCGEARIGNPPLFKAISEPAIKTKSRSASLNTVTSPPPEQFTVDLSSRLASRKFYNSIYLAPLVDPGWNGNLAACAPGLTTPAFRDHVMTRVNYFRAMAGVPAWVTPDPAFSAKAQHAALMMSKNNQLTHYPPTSWLCFSQDGAEAAANSCLLLGKTGPDAVTDYIRDWGPDNTFVGHRRWLLFPNTQRMGSGDVPVQPGYWSANTLWVLDENFGRARPATREPFVAWPPPGYVPSPVVFARWSLSYPKADFSRATITMTSAGQDVPLLREPPAAGGYGDNTTVWRPRGLSDEADWPIPDGDTAYEVVVRNIIINGVASNLSYRVTIYNPAVPGSLWEDAMDLGGGWKWLDWFGFFAEFGNGWIFHERLGFLFCAGSNPQGFWAWSPGLGWLWTGSSGYPYFYSIQESSWLWYLTTSTNPRWFFNTTTGAWQHHP
jgi:uncharacterized protein YkwD